ncbi:hypothetical protein [Streptomyces sp. NPDC093093]|uniref:hypothetical protein n=1 Tax=Streptomyces sp. NPDC093093 TaxID=3366025 RepID=UPI0037F862B7
MTSSMSLTFPVRTDQLAALRQAIEQADRQTRAHGLGGCHLTRGPVESMPWPDINGVPIGTVASQDVTVTLPLLQFEGWTVIAQVEHDPAAGSVVTALPPYEDEAADRIAHCDACGERGALTSYLLRHEDGSTMQLGTTCAGPYANLPVAVLRDLWRLIRWCTTVEPYEPGEVPPDLRLHVDQVLEYAVALTVQAGYVKRGEGWTTAEQVRALLLGGAGREDLDQLHEHLRAAEDVAATAAAVRDWCRRGDTAASDYRHKLARAVARDVAPGDVGLLASAVPMYLRETQRQLTAKDRESITATVTEVSPLASQWGERRRIRFTDGAGRLYAWDSMAQPFPDEGQRLRVTGRVVRNAVREGKVETYLTRCRVAPA